jgi:3-phosphoinositide dependent protein kinase-1
MFACRTFVSVYSAVEVKTGERYAVKIVDRYRCGKLKKTNDLYMEKHCLRRTNHPNIIKMLAWFSDTLNVWVVLEECLGGELWDLVKTVGCPKNMAHHHLTQLLNGCEYLRQANIVHRDIKAENIMITDMGVLKMIDFGTAKDLENPHIKGSGNQSRQRVFEDYVGTPQFMPVEVIENKYTDFRTDTWSLGCTIFQVLAGLPPFHGASEYLIFLRVMDYDLKFPPGVDAQAEDLIRRMMAKDADSRLGCKDLAEVRSHPYFEGAVFQGAHKRSLPVLSLVDTCLRKVGQDMNNYEEELAKWDGLGKLTPEVRAQLERMKLVQKWQDDVLPPPETV